MAFCSGNQKQVRDKRFDVSHLTNVRKITFFGLTKTITYHIAWVSGLPTGLGERRFFASIFPLFPRNAWYSGYISQRLSIERESNMQMRHVQKVYSDKIKSTVSFNAGVFWKVDTVSGSKSLTFFLLQMAKNIVNTIRPRSKESLYLLSFLVF